MSGSLSSAWKHALLVAVSTFGCGGSGSASTAPASTSNESATSATGDTDDVAPLVVELRPDLCDDPANAALVEGLLATRADEGDPSFGRNNPEQLERMVEEPLAGPFYMVNLIQYRDRAVYPDGRETGLSSEEANALYSPIEFLDAIGARVVFSGPVSGATSGDADTWDTVSIVEYPCPLALFAMGADPDFHTRAIHKEAGLESSIVMVTHRRSLDDIGAVEVPFPTTEADPSFEHVRVVRTSEQAHYGSESGEPERRGDEALDLYAQAVDAVAPAYGLVPRARLDVQGVFIGDDRSWDQVWIDFVPSRAAWDAVQQEPSVVAARHHFDAAVEEDYGLSTRPIVSMIPGAPKSGNSGPGNNGGGKSPPTTSDGTGTACNVDADCPGDGVDTCINPSGNGGFCTRQGCGPSQCEAPYACCHDCSDAVANILPFEGSACLPSASLEKLTQPPISCTCD